jgi:peptidoglycan/LPS O-acetylase OafA/YrhL
MNITSDIYRSITSNKLFFSGVAISGIILSHFIGVDREHLFWSVFYPGFVGVDIFLFYSGYGLCRSLENNTLKTFYMRRLKRIYPMLALFTMLSYWITYALAHEHFSALDVLSNMLTLNFWGLGGFRFEWYLTFIVYLYLLFPLLYRFVRRWGIVSVIISFFLLYTFLYFYREGWFYQCAFSRIPVFLLGILCYQRNTPETYKQGLTVFLPVLLLTGAFFYMGFVQKFELVYMSAPFILFLLAFIFSSAVRRQNRVYSIFSFLGKYSLEIYLSNLLVLSTIPHIQLPVPVVLTYAGLHMLFVPGIVSANRFIQKIL